MKKNDLVKLAAIGIAAGLCISGQTPMRENKEIAMTKCSKDTGDAEASDTGAPSSCHGQGWENHPKNKTSQLDNDSDNKSAAKRVIEGSSNTSLNGKRKSAAQRATEG